MPGYPPITDYNEAVQHPETAFLDRELRAGRIRENALGLPMVLSGGFALTYMMSAARRTLAVRCFHREIPAVEQKYAAISRTFRALRSPYFVDFEFLAQGIRVHRRVFPILKMDWAEGDVLGLWLDRHCTDRQALANVRQQFAALAQYLEDRHIAHGDVQNGNIIVSARGIKLIDYDGVHVPGMELGQGSESGHKHFQHPQRDTRHHGPGIDRFSFVAIDVSLAALIEDPSLFRRYGEGGETILFRANDFADPAHSEVFDALQRITGLRGAVKNLATVCRAPIEAVPTLRQFQALGETGGAPAPIARSTAPRPAEAARYIGTYPVVDAADFAAVMSRVGHRVELVGRVTSVELSSIKSGSLRGLPCLHVNFVKRWRQVVRITIGSGRGGIDDETGQEWVGKEVSAAGLIGQPFVAESFLVSRTEIGIALDDPSQLNFISAAEAERRLAQSPPRINPSSAAMSRALSNRRMVRRLVSESRSLGSTTPRLAAAKPLPRPNLAIVRQFQALPQPVVQPRAAPPISTPAPSARRRTGPVPPMVIRPRMPGTPPPAPIVRPAPPPPPTLLTRLLQAFGLTSTKNP